MAPATRQDLANAEAILALVGAVLLSLCWPTSHGFVFSWFSVIELSTIIGTTVGCAIGGIRFAKGKKKVLAWLGLILMMPWLIQIPMYAIRNWRWHVEFWTNPIYREMIP
jgi:hypothetical protein